MRFVPLRNSLVLASVLVAAACADGRRGGGPGPTSNPGTSPGPTAQNDGGATDPDMKMATSPYPQGPYGNQPGETLGDFSAAGYTASHTWSTSIKLSDIRANPACKCLIISIGATWCSACQEEQPDLIQDVSSDPAFCVVGILQEGASGSRAVRADVDEWTDYYNQNFTVLQGNSATEDLMNGYGSSVALPFGFIVKPSTMEVLENTQGYASNLHSYARSLCGY
jgi:hypothetical protein